MSAYDLYCAISETYLAPYRISRMEHFAKVVNGQKPLTIFAKRSILDV